MLVKHEIAFSVVSPITAVVGSNTKAAAYVFPSSSPAAQAPPPMSTKSGS